MSRRWFHFLSQLSDLNSSRKLLKGLTPQEHSRFRGLFPNFPNGRLLSPGPLSHTKGSQESPLPARAAPPDPSPLQFSGRFHCCSCCRSRSAGPLGGPCPAPPPLGSQEYGMSAGTTGGCLPCPEPPLCREWDLSGERVDALTSSSRRRRPHSFPGASPHIHTHTHTAKGEQARASPASAFLYIGGGGAVSSSNHRA